MGKICEDGIRCAIAEERTVVRVVRDGTGRLVIRVGTAASVVLSERFGGIESVDGVSVIWLILQDVVVCASTGRAPGDQDASLI